MWLGYRAPSFPGSDWIPAVLGTIVFLYGGKVFLDGARTELGDRQPGMMTLISMAIVVAFVASWAATLGFFEVDAWWELATMITVMSLGHWIEMRSIMQAQGALGALAELLPDTAERLTDAAMSVGALVMNISTIVVALNAQLLRRLDLRPGNGVESTTPVPRPA